MNELPPQIARLLVVDDLRENLDLLSRRLIRAGYRCTTATNGADALEILHEESFDLVLLDSMMPGMSGPEMLAILRKEFTATALPVIMVTALSESEEIVGAFSIGANDYVTKPIDFPVLFARIATQLELKSAVDQVRLLEGDLEVQNTSLREANTRISKLNDTMTSELEAAGRIQRGMLPMSVPDLPGIACSWAYQPCDQLGGDLLNVFQLTPDEIALYVFDISGHGVSAALQAVMLHQLLSNTNPETSMLLTHDAEGQITATPPTVLASRLNRMFPMDDATGQYFTLLYCILNVKTRQLRGVSAGHPPPLLWHPDGAKLASVEYGSAIGWFANSEYEEFVIDMTPDLRLLLYSDGLTEAGVLHKDAFGTRRLASGVSNTAEASLADGVAQLLAAVTDWCAPFGFDDDLSLLAVQLL